MRKSLPPWTSLWDRETYIHRARHQLRDALSPPMMNSYDLMRLETPL